ncbi:MAG TPA: tetraacyldisaccharide 4'-kinase [Gemmatimonadaceae bacterium]
MWYGGDALAGMVRAALSPVALLYGGGVALRGALYDAGLLRASDLAVPAVSVGNLTVGGTGKTPAAAWFAAQLAARGARPAIVLRGYGTDEPLVHGELNPGIPVIVSADRVAGVARAAAGGADVAVLDDAFQHRRARRDVDVVVVSADRWVAGAPRRLLPAGPWREPLSALRRGTLALVTRRAVSRDVADTVAVELVRRAPHVPVAVAALALGELRRVDGNERQPLAALRGARVFVVAGIGDPRGLGAQLQAAGATVIMRAFGDHHDFTARDVATVVSEAARVVWIVCTLKDAVKLRPQWTRALPPLWYVSQQFVVESGEPAVQAVLGSLLDARYDHPARTARTVHKPPTDS